MLWAWFDKRLWKCSKGQEGKHLVLRYLIPLTTVPKQQIYPWEPLPILCWTVVVFLPVSIVRIVLNREGGGRRAWAPTISFMIWGVPVLMHVENDIKDPSKFRGSHSAGKSVGAKLCSLMFTAEKTEFERDITHEAFSALLWMDWPSRTQELLLEAFTCRKILTDISFFNQLCFCMWRTITWMSKALKARVKLYEIKLRLFPCIISFFVCRWHGQPDMDVWAPPKSVLVSNIFVCEKSVIVGK